MTKVFAVIADGYVTIFDEAAGFAPMPVEYGEDDEVIETERHPAIPEDAVELSSADAEIVRSADGPFVYVGDTIVPFASVPDWRPSILPSVDELISYTAQKRWERETSGITVNGVAVATDDRSKIMIIGARVKADANQEFTTKWKIASGQFVTIDAATIIAISDAVLAHVDACFAAEDSVLASIEIGEITTFELIDTVFTSLLEG